MVKKGWGNHSRCETKLGPTPGVRTSRDPVFHHEGSVRHDTRVAEEAGDQIREILVFRGEKAEFPSKVKRNFE